MSCILLRAVHSVLTTTNRFFCFSPAFKRGCFKYLRETDDNWQTFEAISKAVPDVPDPLSSEHILNLQLNSQLGSTCLKLDLTVKKLSWQH